MQGNSEWRKLYNEELNDQQSSPNIVRLIKSRRMKWAGQVAHMGRTKVYTGILWGNLKGGEYLEHLGIHGSIILGWIIGKLSG